MNATLRPSTGNRAFEKQYGEAAQRKLSVTGRRPPSSSSGSARRATINEVLLATKSLPRALHVFGLTAAAQKGVDRGVQAQRLSARILLKRTNRLRATTVGLPCLHIHPPADVFLDYSKHRDIPSKPSAPGNPTSPSPSKEHTYPLLTSPGLSYATGGPAPRADQKDQASHDKVCVETRSPATPPRPGFSSRPPPTERAAAVALRSHLHGLIDESLEAMRRCKHGRPKPEKLVENLSWHPWSRAAESCDGSHPSNLKEKPAPVEFGSSLRQGDLSAASTTGDRKGIFQLTAAPAHTLVASTSVGSLASYRGHTLIDVSANEILGGDEPEDPFKPPPMHTPRPPAASQRPASARSDAVARYVQAREQVANPGPLTPRAPRFRPLSAPRPGARRRPQTADAHHSREPRIEVSSPSNAVVAARTRQESPRAAEVVPDFAEHSHFIQLLQDDRCDFLKQSCTDIVRYNAQRQQLWTMKQHVLQTKLRSSWEKALRAMMRAVDQEVQRQTAQEQQEAYRGMMESFEDEAKKHYGSLSKGAERVLSELRKFFGSDLRTEPKRFEELVALLSGPRFLLDDSVSVLYSVKHLFEVTDKQFADQLRIRMKGVLDRWHDSMENRVLPAEHAEPLPWVLNLPPTVVGCDTIAWVLSAPGVEKLGNVVADWVQQIAASGRGAGAQKLVEALAAAAPEKLPPAVAQWLVALPAADPVRRSMGAAWLAAAEAHAAETRSIPVSRTVSKRDPRGRGPRLRQKQTANLTSPLSDASSIQRTASAASRNHILAQRFDSTASGFGN